MNSNAFKVTLTEALQRLYLDKRAFLAAFRKQPSSTIEQFFANPAAFGPLRTYVGPLSVKANIARVRRLLLKIQRAQNAPLKSD